MLTCAHVFYSYFQNEIFPFWVKHFERTSLYNLQTSIHKMLRKVIQWIRGFSLFSWNRLWYLTYQNLFLDAVPILFTPLAQTLRFWSWTPGPVTETRWYWWSLISRKTCDYKNCCCNETWLHSGFCILAQWSSVPEKGKPLWMPLLGWQRVIGLSPICIFWYILRYKLVLLHFFRD